jgi:hypothetical protein
VLESISGTCAKGISLQHVNNAMLKGIQVTGMTGPLLATNDVSGAGLEAAEKYTPPPGRGTPNSTPATVR